MGFNRPSKEKLARSEGYTPYLDLGEDAQAIKNYSGVALKLIGAFRELSEKIVIHGGIAPRPPTSSCDKETSPYISITLP
jgi:hypothetical protein